MSDVKSGFIENILRKISAGTFVKLTLGKKRGGDDQLKNIYVTYIELKGEAVLSFLYRYKTRDETKNFAVAAGIELVESLLGEVFMSCHLFGTDGNVELSYSRKLKARINRSKATFKDVRDKSHDKKKKRFIESAGNDYLKLLGVVSKDGHITNKKEKKFRQINKFIEVVDGIIRSSALKDSNDISVVDMGAGKGYLTFALYDYLTNTLGKNATVVGVEARQEMVDKCNGFAAKVGFSGLSFVKGYINDYELKQTDMLIALHACDTATDDAMYQGVQAGAEVILCSPCCHKQLSPQLSCDDANVGLISFGIHRERQATMVTDTMRALLLQSQGYKTNVFEFISSEHTGKNLMVSAVKQVRTVDSVKAYAQVDALKQSWGITTQHLDKLLRG